MSIARIASRYAKSLLDLAIENGKLEKVVDDIKLFQQTIGNRDLYLLIKSPIVRSDKKEKVFKALFENKIDALTSSFYDIIIRKGGKDTFLKLRMSLSISIEHTRISQRLL